MTPSGSDEHILGSSASSSASSAFNDTKASSSNQSSAPGLDETPQATKSSSERHRRRRRRFQSQVVSANSRPPLDHQFNDSNNHFNHQHAHIPPKRDKHKQSNDRQQMIFSKSFPQKLSDPAHEYDQVVPDSPELVRAKKRGALKSTNNVVVEKDSNNNHKPTATNVRQTLKHWLILSLFVIGLLICLSSLACLLLLPTFVSQQVSRKLVLKNGSMLLERWSKPNVPMYFKVWIYNVKNAQELISKQGTRPQVEEVGPFVFNLKRQKDVISFAGENLYYTERKIYKFNRELSCCAINTTVTIPNIPLVAVVDRAMSYNLPLVGRFIPRLINRAIQSLREPMFVRKQAREILFEGYDVELLKMVSRIGSLVGLPQQSQRFGLLKGRNDTWRPEQDGVWAINTGQRDRHSFGRVSSWNSYRKLPYWSQAQCNVINGSDGTLFPPPIKNTQPLYIFNQELCRTVNLVYNRPSDVHSIEAYRFVLNPMNFAHTVASPQTGGGSGTSAAAPLGGGGGDGGGGFSAAPRAKPVTTTNTLLRANTQVPNQQQVSPGPKRELLRASASESQPTVAAGESLHTGEQERLVREAQRANSERHKQQATPMNPQTCFCDRKTTNLNGVNVCEFDGLIDLSKCSKQAQVIFGSMPHFYNSDPRLLRQVDGMSPNASKHTTYLDIEPNTGLVLGGKRRVQLNLIVKRNNEIDGFENINDMLVPIVWFEESAQIPEEAANKFKTLYTNRIRKINYTLLSLFLASLALLAIDLRLMIGTHYWRQFRVNHHGPSSSPSTRISQASFRQKQQHLDSEHTEDTWAGSETDEEDSSDYNHSQSGHDGSMMVVIQSANGNTGPRTMPNVIEGSHQSRRDSAAASFLADHSGAGFAADHRESMYEMVSEKYQDISAWPARPLGAIGPK